MKESIVTKCVAFNTFREDTMEITLVSVGIIV